MTTAAVIGCGDVSTVHFEALTNCPGVDLVAVCDTNQDRLAAAAEAQAVPGFTHHLEMLDQAHPDVVHICTPHDQHVSVAVDCLNRGVQVLLEKPLAHTLAEGQRLVQAAAQGSARVGVCFQNRYNAPVQAMHQLLRSGEIGPVLGAAATVVWSRPAEYYRSRPWRGSWAGSGGGLLMNQAIHTLDLLQWLLGEVAEVRGHASTRALGAVIEVEDTAELMLTHSSGARSLLYASLANAVNAPVTLDITAEKAVLSLRGDLTVSYTDGRVEVVPERLAASGGRGYWGVSHELLIRDFYRTLADTEPFWISPAEAMKSLAIIKDVYAQSYPASVPFS